MNRLAYSAILAGLTFLFCNFSFANSTFSSSLSYNVSPRETQARLLDKAGVLDLRYSEIVQKNIESYIIRARPRTRRILGRAQMYFPIIEKQLRAHNLPEELKYLTVIESSMSPNAISSVGAVGLWQLMPSTARRFGLIINNQVDERRDPLKSTQAAIKYLTFLHKLLGDWTLAVAAFNCGGGGAQKAIRLGQAADFWEIKEHLPEQTQHYINRLAAAVYVMNYYHLHNLQPADEDYFLKFTKIATIHHKVTFQQISEALDIPIPIIKRLNPSYRQLVLPDSTRGNYLVLPKVKMDGFIDYYNTIVAEKSKNIIRG